MPLDSPRVEPLAVGAGGREDVPEGVGSLVAVGVGGQGVVEARGAEPAGLPAALGELVVLGENMSHQKREHKGMQFHIRGRVRLPIDGYCWSYYYKACHYE